METSEKPTFSRFLWSRLNDLDQIGKFSRFAKSYEQISAITSSGIETINPNASPFPSYASHSTSIMRWVMEVNPAMQDAAKLAMREYANLWRRKASDWIVPNSRPPAPIIDISAEMYPGSRVWSEDELNTVYEHFFKEMNDGL